MTAAARLRQLAEAATPGPWRAGTEDPQDVVVWGPGRDEWVANVGHWLAVDIPPDVARHIADADFADAALIVHLNPLVAARIADVLDAAEALLALWENGPDPDDIERDVVEPARAALAALDESFR